MDTVTAELISLCCFAEGTALQVVPEPEFNSAPLSDLLWPRIIEDGCPYQLEQRALPVYGNYDLRIMALFVIRPSLSEAQEVERNMGAFEECLTHLRYIVNLLFDFQLLPDSWLILAVPVLHHVFHSVVWNLHHELLRKI